MKNRFAISSIINLIMLVTIVGFAFQQPREAKAQPAPAVALSDAEIAQLLPGKWRQQFGAAITEVVYLSNGQFTSLTGDGITQFYSAGRWAVKYGAVYAYFEDWQPRCTPNLDGTCTPIRMPAWEATPVRFLDYNRMQNKLGIAYRVS